MRRQVLVAALVAASAPAAWAQTGAAAFWSAPRKGANTQNTRVGPAYWAAVRAAGIPFVRLVPDGWRAAQRDFLIGDADRFTGLDTTDLRVLRGVLDDAAAAGVRVVLTMVSLPGARWRQLNDDRDDGRLWTTPGYREQAFAFWGQLAAALRGHPAIVALDPLNEPHPERAAGVGEAGTPGFAAWAAAVRGTTRDLNAFNRGVVAAIRRADPDVPVMLEGWDYASALGLTFLDPVDDPRVLYAFHYYEPWAYTTFRANRGRFAYPSAMPRDWSPRSLTERLDSVAAWATRHGIAPGRIVAAEFGVDRRVPGAQAYLSDLVAALNRRGWHWAFYAFRDDGGWGGMDYELGTAPPGAAYWAAVEAGADPETLKRRSANPLWNVLAREFRPE